MEPSERFSQKRQLRSRVELGGAVSTCASLCARAAARWQLGEEWCLAVRTLSLGRQGAIRAKISPQLPGGSGSDPPHVTLLSVGSHTLRIRGAEA